MAKKVKLNIAKIEQAYYFLLQIPLRKQMEATSIRIIFLDAL